MIVIKNNDFIEKVKRSYDDYRVNHVIIKCGYDSKYPFVMEIKESDGSVIKRINVNMDMHVTSVCVAIIIESDDGMGFRLLETF